MVVAAVAVTVAAATTITSSATTGKIDVMSVCVSVCDAEKDRENEKKIGKDCRPEREKVSGSLLFLLLLNSVASSLVNGNKCGGRRRRGQRRGLSFCEDYVSLVSGSFPKAAFPMLLLLLRHFKKRTSAASSAGA